VIAPLTRVALARSRGVLHQPAGLTGPAPRVTVVVPCYNYGHFLPECVASALDQPGADVDVIIVDDASPDGSGDVAERISHGDPRISVVRHQQNRGHLATYNDGFERATGDYLVQLSADDLLPPGTLMRSVALLERFPDVVFVYGFAAHFTGSPPAPRSDVRAWITWRGEDWIETRCRAGYNAIQTSEVVMRTKVVRDVGMYRPDLPHSGDLELWMRMARVGNVGFVAGPDQAWYRLHESNMHNATFRQGTIDGQFVDLEHRWSAFDAALSAPAGRLGNPERLAATARRTLAREALGRASYAHARGFRTFPVARFEEFAFEIDPAARRSSAGRALARRKRMGMTSLPLHPLWAPSALGQRLRRRARWWRLRWAGV
jgi:GT2 family glycosyltransferase